MIKFKLKILNALRDNLNLAILSLVALTITTFLLGETHISSIFGSFVVCLIIATKGWIIIGNFMELKDSYKWIYFVMIGYILFFSCLIFAVQIFK